MPSSSRGGGISSLKSYPDDKPRNLNDIMRQDPSARGGIFNKIFERKCQVELKIVEKSIISMVGQVPVSNEKLQFKLMTKNSTKKDSAGNFYPDLIRLELMSDNDYFFQYVYE